MTLLWHCCVIDRDRKLVIEQQQKRTLHTHFSYISEEHCQWKILPKCVLLQLNAYYHVKYHGCKLSLLNSYSLIRHGTIPCPASDRLQYKSSTVQCINAENTRNLTRSLVKNKQFFSTASPSSLGYMVYKVLFHTSHFHCSCIQVLDWLRDCSGMTCILKQWRWQPDSEDGDEWCQICHTPLCHCDQTDEKYAAVFMTFLYSVLENEEGYELHPSLSLGHFFMDWRADGAKTCQSQRGHRLPWNATFTQLHFKQTNVQGRHNCTSQQNVTLRKKKSNKSVTIQWYSMFEMEDDSHMFSNGRL